MFRSHLARNLPLLRSRTAVFRSVSSGTSATTSESTDGTSAENAQPQELVSEVSTPWYLRSDVKSTLLEEKEIKLPKIPEKAPPLLEEFLSLLAKDYGMEELSLFDMTRLDDSHEFRSNNKTVDYILIATGKSERHNFKAASELRNHIKHVHNVIPLIEGMVASGKTPAQRRRLLRQARKGPSSTDNDFGKAANSWVLFHHENVDVHLMTAERRRDLNLESLWCSPDELHMYEQQQPLVSSADHIFSGIRRFHTMVPCRQKAPASMYVQKLMQMPVDSTPQDFAHLKSEIRSGFKPKDAGDYNTQIRLLKMLHCLQPEVVTLQEVENAFYEKHSVVEVTESEKSDDVTEFLKLVVDSPLRNQTIEAADQSFAMVSTFISNLYAIGQETFQMHHNAEFLPLLWSLSFQRVSPGVMQKDVTDIIDQKVSAQFPPPADSAAYILAANSARNVLDLIEQTKQEHVANAQITDEFKEMVMFTYGNAGKWNQFWDHWNKMHFPKAHESGEALKLWIRLVVFLASVSDKSQALFFLNNYWKNSACVSGSFLEALESNNGFNNETEKEVLVKAVTHMVDLLDSPKRPAFGGIKEQLHSF